MKKVIAFIIAVSLFGFIPVKAQAEEKLDFVNAKAAVLMCLDNGQILYAENENEHLSPASVTKIMTILLVLEALENNQISLTDTVTASAEAVSMGGSQIWLEQGEQMTVEELFKAVVVASANDACTALAEYVGGSTSGFVKMMNERAAELGCTNTNFENCNGLDDTVTNHYSSALDLALITREVMKHEIIKKYTTIWLDSLRNGETELNNTNKLVNTYNGITGLKTGTTSNAGFCVSATAERDGMKLAAVILGSETSEERFDSAANLLEWGFTQFELVTPEIDEAQINSVNVKMGEVKSIKPVFNKDIKLLVKKGSGELKYKYELKENVNAPVKKNQMLGKISISDDNGLVTQLELLAEREVKRTSIWFIFKQLIVNI